MTCLNLSHHAIEWKQATKTQGLRAKHISSIFADVELLDKFLLQTLECDEHVTPHSMMCVGPYRDVWVQTPAKLFAKYTIESVDDNGWFNCSPKLGNIIDCFELTSELCQPGETIHIQAQWGEVSDESGFIQSGTHKSYVCRSLVDPSDVWIVERKIFLNSYNII